ncbi:MAG: hypothetical protein HN742_33160 [Lentisphaerae bacterium]|jgi:hypothetical protein|nr:hypothetical protein [Lentisphaerota bacterium]MBT4818943.1 hypothetical protein [Lentisphaerota bacterium]MBT5612928.1 hypothetical protein [Lentisphaerota bacterium]MBT7054036.1 hypothetical protein [Lentisphaerota bacterium]MBT7846767.1 hypothetical protein [Lentisphaerota bacterium]
MNQKAPASDVQLVSEVRGTVRIRRRGEREWHVAQCSFGDEHDNNQNVTWLRLVNPGRQTTIRIHLKWAEFRHMDLRRIAYVRQGETYGIVRAEAVTPTTSTFDVAVPGGESLFGAFPWYSNADGEQFLERVHTQSSGCTLRSIGTSGDDRPIQCLTIDTEAQGSGGPKGNVVVIGRMHANETCGSWAIEGATDFLLGDEGRDIRDRYVFHLIPIVNPDGAANATKLTRMGPVAQHDMVQGGVTSDDPTIKALRDELYRLQPVALISHHCYLLSVPFLGVFEKQVGLTLLDELVWPHSPRGSAAWMLRFTGPEAKFIRHECFKRFGTTVVFTELPWQGRLPNDIAQMGADILRATMIAHEAKSGRHHY